MVNLSDIWARHTLAQEIFEFGQCHGESTTEDVYSAVLSKDFNPALLDGEGRIEDFTDELEALEAMWHQRIAANAEQGINILTHDIEQVEKDITFLSKVLRNAINDTDRYFQPEVETDVVEWEDPILHILRSWYVGLRSGRQFGTAECDWLVLLTEQFTSTRREELQIWLGAFLCLSLAAPGGGWDIDAKRLKHARDAYEAKCVETVTASEDKIFERHYLSESEMVILLDFAADARRIAKRLNISLEDALIGLIAD